MPSAKFKAYLNLHLIVFIWGFTAVLGALIQVKDASLVWYRMLSAGIFLLLYLLFSGKKILLPLRAASNLVFVGLLIAIHWVFFFRAINISNVSVTLAMFSAGAFLASVLEPLFYKRKMLWYEVLFGLVIIAGLFMIMNVEVRYIDGALCALFSVFVGVVFTLFNGKLIQKHDPAVITLYEFFAGTFFVSLYLLYEGAFTPMFFKVSLHDWMLILLLSSVCTAYAFTASVNVMKKLTPYTVMLTTNLEPVYGIVLAYFIIGQGERMSLSFYVGASVIIVTVILNGVIKNYSNRKSV
ncbi:MAG: EamA family transporter [Flavobacterium sp. BFFFF1]|uniref:DMT family transporter n=1 Tax=Flavobacterium sp. BFFFF1 TaxID=2015557 RepID=UPI000BDDC833|nr:DMT family transporter [Flavobacterium sp. BFFFF1]OYU80347.1 MAG: EamA family transporter [Flavobacterium sp. BFFFF1]